MFHGVALTTATRPITFPPPPFFSTRIQISFQKIHACKCRCTAQCPALRASSIRGARVAYRTRGHSSRIPATARFLLLLLLQLPLPVQLHCGLYFFILHLVRQQVSHMRFQLLYLAKVSYCVGSGSTGPSGLTSRRSSCNGESAPAAAAAAGPK